MWCVHSLTLACTLTHMHTHREILFRQKEQQNDVVCMKMEATEDYHLKQIKSVSERQILHVYKS